MGTSAKGAARSAVLLLGSVLFATSVYAQGVTTSSINGIVRDDQGLAIPGATIEAVHVPSGTRYEAVTNEEGRFTIPGMRVGGPYSVTASLSGFQPQTVGDISLNLGIGTDVELKLGVATVAETVTVSGKTDPVFSSTRTGAGTAVSREDLATLPTVSGRITDITRLTPQAGGSGSFAGQDNRLNNITVDGSYFNNSFGLGSAPGERTNVAPISLESLEQVQVNIAPFDVRQGSFIGAAVNSVTRSGTNKFTASVYHRMRNEDFSGTEARGFPVNVGTFTFRDTGVWGSGPIVRNKLFVFGNYENEEDKRPLTTFVANAGGEAVTGAVTRVLASDLNALSAFLRTNFNYDTGPYEGLQDLTPAKRYLLRTDYNLTNNNKISFRYNQLDSSSGNYTSGSSSAGIGQRSTGNFLTFQRSTYSILENIKSGIGEWNSVIGSNMANNLIVGLTSNDESRGDVGELFPFVDVLQGGTVYASFGTEPFSVQNELRYKTLQFQNSFTRFGRAHTWTFGATTQRYESENVFWSCCPQGNYTYNSLADFYTDAQGYLANPNRATSPVMLRRYKLRYSNFPGLDKPLQPLEVWYSGAYAQDEWRPRTNVTVTAGVRADASMFKNTAYQNANADAVTFRDENGQPIQYKTGEMPKTKVLWSPRAAVNWDVGGRQSTQVRTGTGLFTGPPLYVWISNQLGNTGVLIGEVQVDNTTAFPFTPDPSRFRPSNITGAPAASYELNVTDPEFRFPQVWRTNAAVDQRLPWGLTGTVEFLYSKDVNGVYYINANLPAAQSTFTGVDNRARWVGTACAAPGNPGGCVTRINAQPGNVVTQALVLKNQDIGKSWNVSASIVKSPFYGLSLRGAYSYGEARNTIDPGSTASSTFANNQTVNDPNNPGLGYSGYSQGHRFFVQTTFTRSYFNFGATTISAFWESKPSSWNFANNLSYVFGGDANGDSYSGNDLIYIPRDASEMNFLPLTAGTRTFTAAEQAAAFEAFIQQDPYLRKNRGKYAERGGLFLPTFRRVDLSLVQDVFGNVRGKRHAGQIRLDISNFGNLLNSDWGVAKRPLSVGITQANGIQILQSAGADAQGRLAYRLSTVNNQLITESFQTTTQTSDVYQILLSFRYTFN